MTSPRRKQNDSYPALVRSVHDGSWKLKQHEYNPEKLSPRRGGELRDVRHAKVPHLGPDPQRSLIQQQRGRHHSPSMMRKSGTKRDPSPSSDNEEDSSASPSPAPSTGENNNNNNNSSRRRSRFNTITSVSSWSPSSARKGGSSGVKNTVDGGDLAAGIPLDAQATEKSIAQFEDRLLRMDLRKADDLEEDTETRPETPVDGFNPALMVSATKARMNSISIGGGNNNSSKNQQQHHHHHLTRSPSTRASISGSADNALLGAGALLGNDGSSGAGASSSKEWENLSPTRGQNPIFGVLHGLPPWELRPYLLQVERDFPHVRTRGLNTQSFAHFLSLLAPNVDLSADLVSRSMSYFECQIYVGNDLDVSPVAVKKCVTFPQLLIRYGADFSPRHTDMAVVAIFAKIAGVVQHTATTTSSSSSLAHAVVLRPNSAIELSELKSAPIRRWCQRHITGHSVARSKWLAVCDALDDPEVQADMQKLIADVVPIPASLVRTDLEKRLFKDKLPNGLPLPPPPVITLDQWRYVVYGSPHLLPLATDLRTVIDPPEQDARKFLLSDS